MYPVYELAFFTGAFKINFCSIITLPLRGTLFNLDFQNSHDIIVKQCEQQGMVTLQNFATNKIVRKYHEIYNFGLKIPPRRYDPRLDIVSAKT